MKIHPAAELFPMMDDEAFEALKEDIRENGLRELGVAAKDGQLLDGRNRYRACQELGIEMDFQHFEDEIDEYAYVISLNLHRRHLTTSQRSMIAARLANLEVGRPSETPSNDGINSRDEAARLLNVSTASVDRAKAVIKDGSDDVIEAVDSGKVSMSLAKKLVDAVPDKQGQADLVREGKGAVREATQESQDTYASSDAEDEGSQFLDTWKSFPINERMAGLKVAVDMMEHAELTALRQWVRVKKRK